MARINTFARTAALPILLVLASAAPVVAQEAGALGAQTLGRPYRFVFLAYAVLWVFAFGWIVAVARRMARLDRRLGD